MKSKLNTLLKFTLVASFLFYLPAFGQDSKWKAPREADNMANPFADDEGAVKKGAKIYKVMCWTCHGKTGKGDGPAGKTLDPKPADHTSERVQNQTDGAIFWKITNGKGQMIPFKGALSKTQRWQLVNFIKTLDAE